MKKIVISFGSLMICFFANCQLQIAPGTSWKSSGTTYVVLNDIGFSHNAPITSLDNIFKFTGNGDDTILGVTLPSFSNIQLAKTSGKLFLGRTINANLVSFQSGLFELNNFS